MISNAISKMNIFLGIYLEYEIPNEIIALAEEREKKREEKKFSDADLLREKINEKGYFIADLSNTFVITKKYLDQIFAVIYSLGFLAKYLICINFDY